MVIGVDFDNTLVSYDRLFPIAATDRGFSLPREMQTKEGVREYLRACDGGELEWRRLQAIVYGVRIIDAEMIEGVDRFFRLCRRAGVPIYVVSHKTEMTSYADPPINLRTAAVNWMESRGFFTHDGFGLSRQAVFFASSRSEKIAKIDALKCTHFVDDLEEVLLDPLFPPWVEGLLFAPAKASNTGTTVNTFESWDGICAHLFGSRC